MAQNSATAEHLNRVWPCGLPGIEAWSSRWSVESTRPHAHEEWQVSLTRSGAGTVRRGSRVESCRAGSLVLLAPGEVHTLAPVESSEAPWIFDTLFVSQNLSPQTGRPGADLPAASRFAALHRRIIDQAEPLDRETALQEFLATLNGAAQAAPLEPTAPDVSLRRVRDYIEARATGAVTLRELAAIAGTGEFHLVRSFRRAFGLPPYAYHLQVRVNRARRLLRRGRPVAEVSLETGFADQAHLTRHFRKLVGLTPGVYRAGWWSKSSSSRSA